MPRASSGSARIFYPDFSQEEVIKRIREVTFSLKDELGLVRVALFGSYATGRQTVASDIDILIVHEEQICDKDKVYKKLMKSLMLPRVELHIVSKTEYDQIKSSKWMEAIEKEGKDILKNK
ncbi:MAG: nucleotidyltransferase domain-containing protein [Candidatus Bathyarchaeia archaeon]|nr:nucleotidyltransferase domain-containing protein [Candidatus Bathyarchaeota archaeon]